MISATFIFICTVLNIVQYGQAFNLQLPGGRQVSFNGETGVLRIQLAPVSSLKVPSKGTSPSIDVTECIEVKFTGQEEKGYGAFAVSELEKDAFIGFYEGEVITSRESLDNLLFKREKEMSTASSNDYIMSLDGGVTFMDGYRRAQDRSSFSVVHLNHADKESSSCNCIRLLEDDRVAFFTSRKIMSGEELCFDYGKNFWSGRENVKI